MSFLRAVNKRPGARAFYDHHRAAGNLHHQALRALGNRPVSILHGRLRHHIRDNEIRDNERTARAHRQTNPNPQAA